MANRTSLLQQWLESIWYDNLDAKSISFGRLLLMPLSFIYSAINRYQRKTQTKDLIKLSCPVIVVGNITVGGTGKTPLTIYLAKLLQESGYQPAIITRGYGGKAKNWPQSVNENSDASLVGDEAVLMAQRTNIPVYAGANRLESIDQLLKEHDVDTIISDDGMQHYKLPRDIQIAVIDAQRQLGNGHCLPAGPLREKSDRLDTCDFIVMNGKCNAASLNTSLNLEMYEMTLSGSNLFNLSSNEERQLSDLTGQQVQALTGIGNPQRFYSTLKENGINVIENSFPDHHAFTRNDLIFEHDDIVIMTEKDAVKCGSLIGDSTNYWYLPVNANLSDGFESEFLDKLNFVKTNKER